jgi:dTDP-4-dehydrorhamnose reductase
MRVTVIGTSGQLAMALRARARGTALQLLEPAKIDVSNRSSVMTFLDAQRPALVLNASAYTAVDRAETESERAFAVNESGPRWLAEWSANAGAALIHVSTDYVFDGHQREAYLETDPVNPTCVYGVSKLAGEGQVRAILERHVIVRTSWVFSEHGHNFVKTMLRLARERDALRVVDDQHGRPTAADDLADALLRAGERIADGSAIFGTYHFANSGPTTWYGLARAILDEQARYTARSPELTPISTAEYPTPARRPQSSVLDTSRFELAFGVTSRHWRRPLADVVRKLVAPQG